MNHMAINVGRFWQPIRERLGCFGDLLSDFVAADNDQWGTERAKINEHERGSSKCLVHGSKREV